MPVFDQERVDRLKQILKWHPRGVTISDLASKMEINRNLVAKYLDILLISGQVEMQVIGAAKVYFLSQRVPIASMLEFSSDMIIVLDAALTIMQVNEPLLIQVNAKKDTLIGRNIKDISHPFLSEIPITALSKETDPTMDQVREFESTFDGTKHYYKLKQLQTAFEDGSHGITLIIEDITDQVSYRKMLEINEAKYRGIVEDQTEFITRFLPDGTLVFVNEAYARYLGKRKEELIGMEHIPDIEKEDISTVNQCIQSLDTENPVKTFECRVLHSCGQTRWNLWTVRAIFDANQKPIEYQGVGRDNTEKREAASRINQYVRDMEFLSRKSQEFVEFSPDADIFTKIGQGLSELLPSALICVNAYDPQSEILTVRAVFSEQNHQILSACFGREFLGFYFTLRTVPEQLRAQAMNQLLEGKLFNTDVSLHDFFFQQVPIETCDLIQETFNLGDKYYGIGLVRHGLLFGVVSFSLGKGESLQNSSLIETYIRQASVVLHRRVTEDSLRKSESRYRGIVEDQTEFVTRFIPDGTLTYVNDSVCKYFQMGRSELIGRSIFSLIPKEDAYQLIEAFHSFNTDNPVQTGEHRVLHPSGCTRWTQWTNRALFDNHGVIVEFQGVGRDITQKKEAETKIRQYIADIEYLSQKSSEFLELSPDTDIYRLICRDVKAILPNAIVVVNSDEVDSEKQEKAITRCVLGDEERDVFSTLFGINVIGMSVNLPKPDELQKERMEVMSRSLVKVPGNLFITLHKCMPEAICTKIEETLNIGDIYAIGLVSQGLILANVAIMLRKGEIIEHKERIEGYIRLASIALLRQKTAETLRENEKLYRSVIENIQDVFYRSDKKGNLIMASPSWARLLGYDSLDDCIGYNIAEKFYFEPEHRKKFLEAVYRNGSVTDYEVVLKCRDGSPHCVLTNSHMYYDDAGSLLGVEGIFREVSERRIGTGEIQDQISRR